MAEVQDDDDLFIIIGASAQELPDVQALCERAANRSVFLSICPAPARFLSLHLSLTHARTHAHTQAHTHSHTHTSTHTHRDTDTTRIMGGVWGWGG